MFHCPKCFCIFQFGYKKSKMIMENQSLRVHFCPNCDKKVALVIGISCNKMIGQLDELKIHKVEVSEKSNLTDW